MAASNQAVSEFAVFLEMGSRLGRGKPLHAGIGTDQADVLHHVSSQETALCRLAARAFDSASVLPHGRIKKTCSWVSTLPVGEVAALPS
jgi:hypothetical protein